MSGGTIRCSELEESGEIDDDEEEESGGEFSSLCRSLLRPTFGKSKTKSLKRWLLLPKLSLLEELELLVASQLSSVSFSSGDWLFPAGMRDFQPLESSLVDGKEEEKGSGFGLLTRTNDGAVGKEESNRLTIDKVTLKGNSQEKVDNERSGDSRSAGGRIRCSS